MELCIMHTASALRFGSALNTPFLSSVDYYCSIFVLIGRGNTEVSTADLHGYTRKSGTEEMLPALR
jgi:hypothetical protein